MGRLDRPRHLVVGGAHHVRNDQHDTDQDDIGRNQLGRFDLVVDDRSAFPMHCELVDRHGRGRLGRIPPTLERDGNARSMGAGPGRSGGAGEICLVPTLLCRATC